ncbi:MAG: carboxymuconolactone decarboxylase family protein [candidate division WOR-3 bacterium]
MKKIDKFIRERKKLNDLIFKKSNLEIKRFFNLDSRVYEEGALPRKFKELLGLVASLVLRCDDCITYHLIRCKEEKVKDEELVEALSVGLIVGGSITIPHLRRAFETWEGLKKKNKKYLIKEEKNVKRRT